MRIMRNVVLLSIVFLVAGCATVQRQASAPAAPAAAKQPAQKADSAAAETEKLPHLQLSGDLLYRLLVADMASQDGDYHAAAKLYSDLTDKTADPRIAELATRNAIYAHDDRMALSAAKTWVRLAPDELQAREFAATLYIRAGETDEALVQLKRILALSSGDNGFMAISSMVSRESNKQTAMAVMKKFIKDYEDNPEALFSYSYVAFRTGHPESALHTIDKALKIKPQWTKAIIFRARMLLLQGKTEGAIEYLKKRIDEQPSDKDLRFAYAQALLNAKRVEQAYAQFKDVLKLTPDDGDVLFTLGVLAIQLNYVDQAEHYLERAKAVDGSSDELSYFLGQVAELKKEYAKAIRDYAAVEGGQYFFDAKVRKATLIAKQGDIGTARRDLQNLRAMVPQRRADAFLAEGDILREAQRYPQALHVYNAGLNEFPGNNNLLYARAYVASKLDKLSLAEHDLHTILSREPDNAEALNALGYTLANQSTRYDEALSYIKRALKLRPDDYFVLDSMGWVQYRLGNYDAAVKYLKRAMNLSNDTEVAAHLGEVLWSMGKQDAARDVWDKALKLSPNNKHLQEVMKAHGP